MNDGRAYMPSDFGRQDPPRECALALIAIIIAVAVAVACMGTGYYVGQATQKPVYEAYPESAYQVSQADLQLPELPTGCEATAGATLLRLNGILASKKDVADAMPKSNGDFVHAFWGDPYTANGWAIMPPGMCDTLGGFLPYGYGVRDLTGADLDNLPVPCQVWTTIALSEPYIVAKQDGYSLMQSTHCMVVLGVGAASVHVIDPLEGDMSYPRGAFESRYNSCGKQAIYISRG